MKMKVCAKDVRGHSCLKILVMKPIQKENDWVIRLGANYNSKLRLFCFPYAGGGISTFRLWPTKLTKEVEVCPIMLPGRESRITEQPYKQLQLLVEDLTQALLPQLTKPFVFFGHSMGSLVSFEVARELRNRHNISPERMFVSARRAPQIPNSEPPIHHLNESEFIEELKRLNGTPEEVFEDTELIELFLPILRADFTAIETYVYTSQPHLSCPITAIGGLQDFEVSTEDLRAWQEQTSSGFLLQTFEGDHFFIDLSQAHLLDFLNQELEMILSSLK